MNNGRRPTNGNAGSRNGNVGSKNESPESRNESVRRGKKRPSQINSSRRQSAGSPAQRPGAREYTRQRRGQAVRSYTAAFVAIFAIVLIVILVVAAKCSSARRVDPGELEILTAAHDGIDETTEKLQSFPEPETVDSRFGCDYIYMEEYKTGRPIIEKASDELAYPASLTKIMTAMVAIENIEDLSSEMTLDTEMFDYISQNSAATAGYEAGETVKAIDMLYGLLLPSGAECAIGLAKFVAGSETAFVKLMNEKAVELGLTGTHFVNSTGLHDLNHYTTAKDMAALLRYALTNTTFRQIFITQEYYASPTNLHPDGLTFTHTVFSSFRREGLDSGYITGGKTGYTDQAKQCMAVLAEKDGVEYILIVMGAGDGTNSENFHAQSVYAILDEYLGQP